MGWGCGCGVLDGLPPVRPVAALRGWEWGVEAACTRRAGLSRERTTGRGWAASESCFWILFLSVLGLLLPRPWSRPVSRGAARAGGYGRPKPYRGSPMSTGDTFTTVRLLGAWMIWLLPM